jgi:hypothetical protein
VASGENAFLVKAAAFIPSRITLGNHNASLRVCDRAGACSNEISVTYAVVNVIPTIVRNGSASWGSFDSSGPASDQVVLFTLTGPDVRQVWRLQCRFDSERWVEMPARVKPGLFPFQWRPKNVAGSRISPGGHTVYVRVYDVEGLCGFDISVSYSITEASSVPTAYSYSTTTLAVVGSILLIIVGSIITFCLTH